MTSYLVARNGGSVAISRGSPNKMSHVVGRGSLASGSLAATTAAPRIRASTCGAVLACLSVALLMVSLFSAFHLQRSLNLHHRSIDYGSSSSFLRQQQQQQQQTRTNDNPPPSVTVTFPVETPIPNPPVPADGYSTFSSCLLVMDDNHRLAEWLAYHYHVLPLRYMVVAVDPRSKTSPTFLFNIWRRMGVTIVEWTDDDFWRGTGENKLQLVDIPDNAELQLKRDRHRGRQKFFYKQCLIHLKEHNRTWVALHDSDEYLLYNHAGGDAFDAYMKALEQRVLNRLQAEKDQGVVHNPDISMDVLKPSQVPPTTAEEGGMIKYIRHEQAAGLTYYKSPCIGVPRLMFGAQESSAALRFKDVPTGIDADRLDTTRYRKHARRNDFVKNALGKVLMDVSRINVASYPNFMSLHRPIKSLCSPPWHNDWESGLRINHYLGSWESYSFRDDSRKGYERSIEQWEYKSTTNAELTDDNIRPWVSGFVQRHGTAKALELLRHAGLPKSYRNPHTKEWHLLPEKLDKILSTNVTIANDNKMVAFDAWVREKYKNSPRMS